jgi:hypothetical protein
MYITLSEDRKEHSIKIANRSFEDLAKIKYFGTTPTNKIASPKRLRTD